MLDWIKRESKTALRQCSGWGIVICPMLFFLAISGNFATDWWFIVLTLVGFFASLFAWIALRSSK
jgi:hypothetical protein